MWYGLIELVDELNLDPIDGFVGSLDHLDGNFVDRCSRRRESPVERPAKHDRFMVALVLDEGRQSSIVLATFLENCGSLVGLDWNPVFQVAVSNCPWDHGDVKHPFDPEVVPIPHEFDYLNESQGMQQAVLTLPAPRTTRRSES
jgi:hypothetical protein